MIRSLVFDLGNVLLYFDRDTSIKAMAKFTGVDEKLLLDHFYRSPAALAYEKGLVDTETYFRGFEASFNCIVDRSRLSRLFADMFRPNQSLIDLLPQFKSLGYRLVLLSNTNDAHISFIMERYPFMKLFDELILSFRVHAMKPDPAIYLATQKASGCEAHECLFTDDLRENIEGAVHLGMKGVLFTDTASYLNEAKKLGVKVGEL